VEGLIDYLKENCCIREGASSGCATDCKPKSRKRSKK